MVQPGSGAPLGESVRTDAHIATLVQSLQPYVPSLHRDHSKDRYDVSLLLVALDGSDRRLIPLREGLEGNGYSLAKVLGSDGRTLWVDVNGLQGVDLRTYELLSEEEVRRVDERSIPKAWNGQPFAPRMEQFLAAGFFTGPDTWLGVHSLKEAERDFKPKSWVKRVVRAEEGLRRSEEGQRRFYRGTLDPDTSDGYHRIVRMDKLNEEIYLNAAFVRMNDTSEPIRLSDPPGAVMIYTRDASLQTTLMVARVDTAGTLRWRADTGLDRVLLRQILPGEASTAFVGTRPAVPDKLSEPLLVIVEHATGKVRTVSLWR
jgi:hypothetical protein